MMVVYGYDMLWLSETSQPSSHLFRVSVDGLPDILHANICIPGRRQGLAIEGLLRALEKSKAAKPGKMTKIWPAEMW